MASLGLLYTTLANGEDRILVPNNVVLSGAVVPLREPSGVDMRARLDARVKPSEVEERIEDAVSVRTRTDPRIDLEEFVDGEIIVRVRATPVRSEDGSALADEVVAALDAGIPPTRMGRRPAWRLPRGFKGRTQDKPLGELVQDLSRQTSTLIRQEMRLAQAELTEKGRHASKGAGMFGGAGRRCAVRRRGAGGRGRSRPRDRARAMDRGRRDRPRATARGGHPRPHRQEGAGRGRAAKARARNRKRAA